MHSADVAVAHNVAALEIDMPNWLDRMFCSSGIMMLVAREVLLLLPASAGLVVSEPIVFDQTGLVKMLFNAV